MIFFLGGGHGSVPGGVQQLRVSCAVVERATLKINIGVRSRPGQGVLVDYAVSGAHRHTHSTAAVTIVAARLSLLVGTSP